MARFFVDGVIRQIGKTTFPFATLFINVGGSFILGLLTSLGTAHLIPPTTKAIVGTGFCGGYTTFSTANFETIRLIQTKRNSLATINIIGTMALTMLAAFIGIEVG
jgi:CrcB protein